MPSRALAVPHKEPLPATSTEPRALSSGYSKGFGPSFSAADTQAADADRRICAQILAEFAAGVVLDAPRPRPTGQTATASVQPTWANMASQAEDKDARQVRIPSLTELLQIRNKPEHEITTELPQRISSCTSDTSAQSLYDATPALTASSSPIVRPMILPLQTSPATPSWDSWTSSPPRYHQAALGVVPLYPSPPTYGGVIDEYHKQQLAAYVAYSHGQIGRQLPPAPAMPGADLFHPHPLRSVPSDNCHQQRCSHESSSQREPYLLRARRAPRESKSCGLVPSLQTRDSTSSGQARKPHCNRPYGDEQADFITYQRVDLRRRWDEIVAPFATQFPLGPRRTIGGLQSLYYRKNGAAPEIDDRGDAVLDPRREDAAVLIRARKVREGGGRWGLLARWPERVVERGYPWVRPEHMEAARKLVHRRRQQQAEHAARVRRAKVMGTPRL